MQISRTPAGDLIIQLARANRIKPCPMCSGDLNPLSSKHASDIVLTGQPIRNGTPCDRSADPNILHDRLKSCPLKVGACIDALIEHDIIVISFIILRSCWIGPRAANDVRAACYQAEVDWFFWTAPIVNL